MVSVRTVESALLSLDVVLTESDVLLKVVFLTCLVTSWVLLLDIDLVVSLLTIRSPCEGLSEVEVRPEHPVKDPLTCYPALATVSPS